jgi:DNA-binding transcriptional MerR regulator
MRASGKLDRLQESIECCSKGAVAYKAAFMLARDPCLDKRLLARCADRYALLERLLNLLGEQGMAPEQIRAMLDGVDSDPARHGRLKTALEEAVACDRRLRDLIGQMVARRDLPAGNEAYLVRQRQVLQRSETRDLLAASGEEPSLAAKMLPAVVTPAKLAPC